MLKTPAVSVIVTTYNWPQALDLVLKKLLAQTVLPFEILIADDGSKEETTQLIRSYQLDSYVSIHHIWQEDVGFRAAMARNRALAVAKGDIVLFLDGDCLVPKNWVARYINLLTPGVFVSGNRVLLSQIYSEQILTGSALPQNLFSAMGAWIRRQINRPWPLIQLPEGRWRLRAAKRWQGAKTCNLGVWRQDALLVNGFDEAFVGWGYEDSDFVVRLQKSGVYRKDGRYALPVWHLWHQERSRAFSKDNYARFEEVLKSTNYKARQGVQQYLPTGAMA